MKRRICRGTILALAAAFVAVGGFTPSIARAADDGGGGTYECSKPVCTTEGNCQTCKTMLCRKVEGKEFFAGWKTVKTCTESSGGSPAHDAPGASVRPGKMIQPGSPGTKAMPIKIAPTESKPTRGVVVSPPDEGKTTHSGKDGGATQVQPAQ